MADPHNPEKTEDTEDFRRTWDTSYVARQDRFSYFREGVCQAFMAISPEPPSDQVLDARIETAHLPGGIVSKISVTPHRVVRTKADVANMSADYMSLGLQIAGGLVGDMNGRDYAENAGDVSLTQISKIRSFDICPNERFTSTALIFEKSVLKDFPALADFSPIGPSYRRPIRDCLSLLNDRYRTSTKAEIVHLYDATLCLLMASLTKDRDYVEERCERDPAVQSGILRAIQKFVDEQMSDPNLTSSKVADHFGISPRYVQKLFAATGSTFKNHLTCKRLDKVRDDIFDRAIQHVPVADIAFRWGFRDMTTFHRNFKLRFADTPGQMRAFGRAS